MIQPRSAGILSNPLGSRDEFKTLVDLPLYSGG